MTARTALVWVEVKRDSGPSGEGQLLNYGRDLEQRLASGEISRAHLVFLTRPGDWSETVDAYRKNEPDGVELSQATWAQTSAALARWARGSSDHPFSQRLVEEFVDYLEEEQVASTGLNLDDAIVLQRFEGTDEAFSTLLELTASELDRWPIGPPARRRPKFHSRTLTSSPQPWSAPAGKAVALRAGAEGRRRRSRKAVGQPWVACHGTRSLGPSPRAAATDRADPASLPDSPGMYVRWQRSQSLPPKASSTSKSIT